MPPLLRAASLHEDSPGFAAVLVSGRLVLLVTVAGLDEVPSAGTERGAWETFVGGSGFI